jgi:hypothetical protein
MATYVTYTGDGSETDYVFPFDYLSASHVKATLDGVATSAFTISDYTLTFDTAPGADVAIRIYRETTTTPIVTWADGAVILGRHLNASQKQAVYIAAEAADVASVTGTAAAEAALAAVQDDIDADVAAAAASATAAASSATAASSSATNAAASVVAAASAYDSFDDRYLGEKASDPTLDNDGNALVTGALYFNTGVSKMKVWTGVAWAIAYNDTGGNASDIANDSSVSGANVANALDALDTAKAPKASPVLSGGVQVDGGFTSTSGTAVLELKPSDIAAGKPGIRIVKNGALADLWQISLWDGVSGAGTIQLAASYINLSGTLLCDGGWILTNSHFASQAVAEAGSDNTVVMTPLRTAQAIAALGSDGGGWTLIGQTTSPAGGDNDFNQADIANCSELMIVMESITFSGTDFIAIKFSDDGGSTFETVSYASEGAGARSNTFQIMVTDTSNPMSGWVKLTNLNGGWKPVLSYKQRDAGTSADGECNGYVETTSVINFIRVTSGSGLITGGTIRLFGRP